MYRLLFPKSDTKSEWIEKLIDTDLSGSIQENSLEGASYLSMMKDDYNQEKFIFYQK